MTGIDPFQSKFKTHLFYSAISMHCVNRPEGVGSLLPVAKLPFTGVSVTSVPVGTTAESLLDMHFRYRPYRDKVNSV